MPLTIFAFKSDKGYYQSAPLRQGQPISVPGFFVPGEDQNFIVLNLFEEESWRAVAHDFAQMLLNYNYPPVQGWFDEGLAEYFSSIRVDNKEWKSAAIRSCDGVQRKPALRNQKRWNPPKSLTELLSGQVWLALPDLLTMKHETTIYTRGNAPNAVLRAVVDDGTLLLHEKKMPETGTYFDLVENHHVPWKRPSRKRTV